MVFSYNTKISKIYKLIGNFFYFPNPYVSNFSDNTQGLTGCLILFFMCCYVPVFE